MKMTKKLRSTVLCIVFLVTMLCAAPVAAATVFGDNVLAENDSMFDGLTLSNKGNWGAWQPNNSTNVTVEPYAEDSEKSYLKLVAWVEAGEGKNATATLSKTYFENKVEPLSWYMMSYRYLSDCGGQGYIEIYDYDTAEDYVKNTKTVKNTNGVWETGTFLFRTGEDTAVISLILGSKGYYAMEDNGGTTTVCFDDVSIRKVTPDTSGTVVNLITGSTSDGDEIVGTDGAIKVQMTSTVVEAGENAVISGYITADKGAAVNVAVTDVEGSGTTVTKTLSGTAAVQPFEMTGISYEGVIEVRITGAGVTADTLRIVKDTNLLRNVSFEDVTDNNNEKSYWSFSESGTKADSYIKADGNCPDGSHYVYFGEGSYNSYASIRSSDNHITGDVGERFLFSIWYKTNKQARIKIEQKENLSETDTNLGSNYMPDITLNSTEGEWRKVEITFEILPTATSFNILLRNLNNLGEGEYVAYDLPVIQRIENGKIGFYTTLDGKASKNQSAPYMTVLGQSVSFASGLTELSAKYITKDGITQNSGKETVMLAVYENIGGKKQLVKVEIADADVPETGKTYPTATLDLTGLSEGCEIRAFAWDGVSGMKPAGNYIKTTN